MINDCICKLLNATQCSKVAFFFPMMMFLIYISLLSNIAIQPSAVVRHYFISLFCTFLGELTIIIIDNDQRLNHG